MTLPLNTTANTRDPIAQARFNMIEQQIRPWDVHDTGVLQALELVRREDFVPPAYQGMAFMDVEIPLLGEPEQALRQGHCMLAPLITARMAQELQLQPTDRVLEIGAGSGYMAALLAHLANTVITLEVSPELADMARENLRSAGVQNAEVLLADGAQGALPPGPFNAIVLSGSVAQVPQHLLALLADGGRLLAIVGHAPVMRATLVRRNGATWHTTQPWDTVAARLAGFAEPSRFAF